MKYDAVIKGKFDGKTIKLDIELVFDKWIHDIDVKLLDLNFECLDFTPQYSVNVVNDILPINQKVQIKLKNDNYENVTIYKNGTNINQYLLEYIFIPCYNNEDDYELGM